jgi:hypothetical protein
MLTSSGSISAAGVSGYVEFRIATAELSGSNGWAFQLSSDGGTTWSTRLSELAGSNHASTLYHYTLAAAELVNTLKMRFQFSGSDPAPPARPSKFYLDDIKVVTTANNAATSFTLYDDGQHGDGTSNDGIYGGLIAGGASSSLAAYTISAADSNAGFRFKTFTCGFSRKLPPPKPSWCSEAVFARAMRPAKFQTN